MSEDRQAEVTECLQRLDQGDRSAVNQLLPHIYDDLHALAQRMFRDQRGDHTLQPTALVHDAYMRLVRSPSAGWSDRRHFFAVAAMAMRQLLADYSRRRQRQKRGGERERVALEDADAWSKDAGLDLVDLDGALTKLAKLNPRQSRVVELRFLTGLPVEQVAEVLEISPRTVKLDWRMARSWLRRELEQKGES